MLSIYRIAGLAAAAAALAASAPVCAQSISGIDALREWNLIVLGDLTSSSEVEGRTFVGGNLGGNSSNYQIRTPASSAYGTPGLIVVGDVLGGTKNLNNGSGALIGGTVFSGFNLNGAAQTVKVGGSIFKTNVNQNTVRSDLAGSDPAFAQNLKQERSLLTSSLTDLSRDMAHESANSVFSVQGNRGIFTATPGGDGKAVFNISAADLDRIGEISFNLNGADTAIVNVSGGFVRLNDNFLGGTAGLGEHVIWNFPDATNIDVSTAWGGSVLAPGAAAITRNYIQGSSVFGSLVQNGEFHLGTYTGGYVPPATPPDSGGPKPVPEPSSWAMFLIGMLGLGVFVARRRRQLAD